MVNGSRRAELDRVYLGKVKRITDFGAFVEIFPAPDDGLIPSAIWPKGASRR